MSDICLLTSLQCYVPIYRESYDSESANQEHSQQIILNSCNLTIRTVVSRVLLLLTLLSITLIPSKPSLADSILPQQISDNRIIMPTTGSVEVIVNNAVTNMCDGNFGIQSPIQQELVQNYNSKRGETHTLGPFEAGTELIFYIQPLGGCAPYTYPSTNTNHARVYVVAEGIWRIEWEDLPDNNPPDYDFDDLIITIRISGAYPDFKQNIGYWSGDIYDHNAGAEFSIANYGCALTAISNLLAYYGARNMDPAVLNVWMKANGGFNDKGGVRWSAPTQYRPPGSNVSVIEWVRNIDRDNPTIDLTQKVREYLELHWPVIVKLNMPSSPSGVHYPVLVDLVGTPGNERYIVKDPYYSNNSITELPVHDSRILQAILYRPADQLPRSSLTLYGLSPIEYLIVDASGRRLGYDPFSDRTYWEIPESSYSYDAPFWLPAGENHTDEGGGLVASIPGAPTGAYRVLVHGTGTGDFKLQAFYDDSTGNTKQTVDLGSTQLGVSTLYDLEIGTSLMSMTPRQTVRVAAQPNRVLPGATSIISVVATDGFGYPIVGETVLFYTSLGSIQSSSVTDSNGVAIGTLQAGNTSGVASITTQLGLSVNRLDVVIRVFSSCKDAE